MRETGAFVVNIPTASDRALAERFGEIRPPIRDPFDGLEVAQSPWGRCWAAGRLAGSAPAGYAELVQARSCSSSCTTSKTRWPTCTEPTGRCKSSTIAGEGRHRPSLELADHQLLVAGPRSRARGRTSSDPNHMSRFPWNPGRSGRRRCAPRRPTPIWAWRARHQHWSLESASNGNPPTFGPRHRLTLLTPSHRQPG